MVVAAAAKAATIAAKGVKEEEEQLEAMVRVERARTTEWVAPLLLLASNFSMHSPAVPPGTEAEIYTAHRGKWPQSCAAHSAAEARQSIRGNRWNGNTAGSLPAFGRTVVSSSAQHQY